ncbi:MAG: carbohydrate ABC transporter permease [Nitrospinota bacterium]|nr:MAG: carbohydrate ABC transporter permease [Nitrospinota bacterium]
MAYLNDRSSFGHKLLGYAGLLLVLLLVLIPYTYILFSAFKPPGEIFEVKWFPEEWSLDAWRYTLESVQFQKYILNSFIGGLGASFIALIIAVPGAYIFGRKQFWGKEVFFYTITLALLFPFVLLVVPMTILWIKLGLYDTMPGLWLAYQVFIIPFALWILRGYFAELPPFLEECAMVYGCTHFQAFYRVMLPLAKPVIVSLLFIAFLIGWSDFLFSNMLTTGEGPRTASVVLYVTAVGGERVEWEVLMVMTLMAGIPPVILYILAQRQLMQTFAVKKR